MKIIYAVRDRIANDLAGPYFNPLVTLNGDNQAIRYFGDSLANKDSALAIHPTDYELIRLGTIEPDGTIVPYDTPEIVITGEALIAISTDHHATKPAAPKRPVTIDANDR